MYEDLDDEQERQEPQRRDTELTLGPLVLVVIFLALVVLCGGAFGLGYHFGHRGSTAATVSAAQPTTAASSSTALSSDASQSKPSAASTPIPAPQPPSVADQPPATDTSAADQTIPAGSPAVQPAAVALTVQVAAVSHPEDADALANALRHRGYPVAVQRDSADSLIHIQVGPFATREEANKWRMKLLSDGYNAILQP